MKTNPNEIYAEFLKLKGYLNKNSVYDNVKRNEDFYIGKQWGTVKGDTPKPVINRIQRCVKHLVSAISSNEVAISMTPMSVMKEDSERLNVISKEVENVIERARIKENAKVVVRNACVDGSSYMMQTFNPNYETGQDMKGRVENQVIDNTNVYFGNPYSNDVQNQPYIIIALRQYIGQVKKEAKENGVPKNQIDDIKPDNESDYINDDSEDLVTVLIKFFKKKSKITETKVEVDLEGNEIEIVNEKEVETVWMTKCTQAVTLINPIDLGYRRYPISCFGWEAIKNSYIYASPVTQQITNQVFINKVYAAMQMFTQDNATPKIVYDKNKVNIEELLDQSPKAVASIDLMGKYMDFIRPPEFANNTLSFVQDMISQMNDSFGVTDADLGNVRPDNTSAIIAIQEASNASLEIQKGQYYQFWEDTVRNVLDIISSTYGIRTVMSERGLAVVDFSMLNDINYELSVEIGSGAQFSEIAQIQTLDKLVQTGAIPYSLYVELVPDKYILGKQKITKFLEEQQQATQQIGNNMAL